MEKQTFFLIIGIFSGLVGLIHLLRALYSWSFVIEDVVIPVWLSYVAVIFLGFLSFWAFKFSKK